MKKAGLIGLGRITAHYVKGLKNSKTISLCAVSDINPSAVSRKLYGEYPFYEDYRQMLKIEKPELVIIASPPKVHFEIAQYCLNNEVGVIVEKPVVLSIEEFDTLSKLAAEKGLLFKTVFHWLGGLELKYLAENYDINKLKSISVRVLDPYSDDEQTIREDRRMLMGAWIDSGVNSLSMLKFLLPFNDVKIISAKAKKCTDTLLPLFADVALLIDGVSVNIQIDWTKHQNLKETTLTLSDEVIKICHTDQSIISKDKTVSLARMPRLEEHYFNIWSNIDFESNLDFSKAVHKILLEVNNSL